MADAHSDAVITEWCIDGAEGEVILGNTHMPPGPQRGVIVIAHGFKGYKDYGMFPCIAQTHAAAGYIAHRFNFSHSGMTNDITTFARPDLFERDTWNKQVADLNALIAAIGEGTLAGDGLPLVLFGHSRGGVAVLLTTGRASGGIPNLAGIITAAAPSTCMSLPQSLQEQLLREAYLSSPSSRTGQELRVGSGFLQEQLDDPQAHDLLQVASHITCPALIIHGADDPTVPVAAASEIQQAIGIHAQRLEIDGANHVFNTPNPMPDDQPPRAELQRLLDAAVAFADSLRPPPRVR